jgi:hypothetical protein
MHKLVIASMRKSAGKTSVILGMAKVLEKKIGYMKPFGDRLLYRKKRLWDYDSALITNVLDLKENPEDMSIGFEHSKLSYMYDDERRKEKLLESVSNLGKDKDVLFVEGGKNLTYGVSVHLDAMSVAKYINGKLLLIIGDSGDSVVDDIVFVKKYIDTRDIDFPGVIINKVHDPDDFKDTYLNTITETGINVLGIIPYKAELAYFSVDYLAYRLFAKVIAGEDGLNNVVKSIFVGAMSADAALRNPLFKKENKLIITSGDRSDMILAALERDTSCIILTNDIVPPSNIISKASDRNIPLLLVPSHTYQITKQIDSMEPLLTKDNVEKINLWKQLIKKYVNLKEITDI